ncbi:MAG: hypothetical protein HY981_03015 [Candidatus Magasanikbacteria bacterium]|nr:hypothetical protein [Candidatus Magasanikbacteria bacterium]
MKQVWPNYAYCSQNGIRRQTHYETALKIFRFGTIGWLGAKIFKSHSASYGD